MDAAHLLVLPLLGHVLLTTVVGLMMLNARVQAGRSGQVRLKDIALNNSAWPERARKFGNNFDNQFQTPLLAYAVVSFYLALGLADNVAVTFAVLFLAARLLHTFEHVNRNRVLIRLGFFLTAFSCIVALWVWFAFRFYVSG